jgi:hypothetical protein
LIQRLAAGRVTGIRFPSTILSGAHLASYLIGYRGFRGPSSLLFIRVPGFPGPTQPPINRVPGVPGPIQSPI